VLVVVPAFHGVGRAGGAAELAHADDQGFVEEGVAVRSLGLAEIVEEPG
jgi:hypothetical protein